MNSKFKTWLLLSQLILCIIFFSRNLYSSGATEAICESAQAAGCIDPAWPTSKVVSIWVGFPNVSDSLIPHFVDDLETDFENFYDKMSNGSAST